MDTNHIKVDGYNHLVRDTSTNAILNLNTSEYENYKMLKQNANVKNEKIEKIEGELFELKNDMNEIKSLLRSLINEPK